MKKTIMFIFLAGLCTNAMAQRYFYVQPNNYSSGSISKVLERKSQFVTQSPLGSDFIIKSEMDFTTEKNIFHLKITVQDSVTLKSIYETVADYSVSYSGIHAELYCKILFDSFVDRNIARVINTARSEHNNESFQYLKARKDKT